MKFVKPLISLLVSVAIGSPSWAAATRTVDADILRSSNHATSLTLPATTDTLVTLAASQTLTNKTISGSANTITNVSLTTGVTGVLPEANGGTNQSTYALGDTIYSSATNTLSKLSGNTTTTKKFLTQTGNGSVSAAPGWNTIVAGDVPTLNQNTTGTASDITASSNTSLTTLSNLVSVGTITTGTWSATTIALNKGGTGQTTKAAAFDALSPMTTGGDLIYGGASGTGTRLANGTLGQILTSNGGTAAPSWGSPSASQTIRTHDFNASGSLVLEADVTTISILGCGGGGGGGGSGANATTAGAGGAGGSGSVPRTAIFKAVASDTLTVTIGTGGGGGNAGTTGNPGIVGSVGTATSVTGTGVDFYVAGGGGGDRSTGVNPSVPGAATTSLAESVDGSVASTSGAGNLAGSASGAGNPGGKTIYIGANPAAGGAAAVGGTNRGAPGGGGGSGIAAGGAGGNGSTAGNSTSSTTGFAAAANSCGGGGGGAGNIANVAGKAGGAGGSGFVRITYWSAL